MKNGYPQMLINVLHKAVTRSNTLEVGQSGEFNLFLGPTRYVFGKEFSRWSYSQLQDYLNEISAIEDEETYHKRRQDRYNQVKAKLASVLSPEELDILNEGAPEPESSSWIGSGC